MHDSEQDTFQQLNKNEEFCESLKKIGIDAESLQIDTEEVEKGNYYSRHFSNTPVMVTNHGVVKLKGSNVDLIQIIQKG